MHVSWPCTKDEYLYHFELKLFKRIAVQISCPGQACAWTGRLMAATLHGPTAEEAAACTVIRFLISAFNVLSRQRATGRAVHQKIFWRPLPYIRGAKAGRQLFRSPRLPSCNLIQVATAGCAGCSPGWYLKTKQDPGCTQCETGYYCPGGTETASFVSSTPPGRIQCPAVITSTGNVYLVTRDPEASSITFCGGY